MECVETSTTFTDLPTEMLTHILSYCDDNTWCALRATCKRFYSLRSDIHLFNTLQRQGYYVYYAFESAKYLEDNHIENKIYKTLGGIFIYASFTTTSLTDERIKKYNVQPIAIVNNYIYIELDGNKFLVQTQKGPYTRLLRPIYNT